MSGGQVHIDPETVFTRFLRGKGCHNTQQRRAIVSVFFQEEGHLTIDDLYGRVQRQDPTVGQSTVYRTMKLLCEAGLAKEVSFGGGVVRYEQASDWHHDHLICECCGKTFTTARADVKYCCEECRYAAQIKRQGERKKALREAKQAAAQPEKEQKTA